MSEPYWVPIGAAPMNVVSIGTTLPASPIDGQEAILVDSLTAPTYAWRFRYTASIIDAYKWVCVGPAPVMIEVNTTGAPDQTASTIYVALGTSGPNFTLPRAGIYIVEIGFLPVVISGASASNASMSYDIGATAAVDTDRIYHNGSVNISTARAMPKTFPTAVMLAGKFKVSANTYAFSPRWMKVTPVRVA